VDNRGGRFLVKSLAQGDCTRDVVEKLVGDDVTECLLAGRTGSGVLAHDEARDCLAVA
jgi:hypothetical protein